MFAHAFAIEQPKGKEKSLDAKIIKEVTQTELTKAEFADALGMQSTSSFVERVSFKISRRWQVDFFLCKIPSLCIDFVQMFDLVDRDHNGFISFREFLDMLIIFAKGSAEDKMKLMFDMYDITRRGALTTDEVIISR